ncbi:MAG: clostripain-related cysteine peptidase [Clostridia bacterium]|nr:clostripain-related cysteine peptidase [Clostridia bacterium]
MKKLRLVFAALLLAALCLALPLCARAESPRKLTVMVYMCGSNLESGYGSASADLEEMLASGFDSEQVSLLVMTGGTEGWVLGFDPATLTINEIGRRGVRAVWREETASMGVPETLSTLLNFGVERFPAEDYALILWNHGGGPMEGVCWDELFSMDNLSLSELTQALDASNLPEKLSWIGFDACLMSSAEVASTLAPYADYMIASQETEPAPGWNYAFLNGLESDADARETGKRIVDAYFDGMAGIRDTVTLACTDLSKISGVTEAMDAFFEPVAEDLDADSFARVSGLRQAAVGFGKSVRAAGEDGYDLVDLGDLVREYGEDPTLSGAARAFAEALDEAVVYCRSSAEGASGLTVYHPYANKAKYAARWGKDYQALAFSDGYRNYLNRFGALLTGEVMADWSGLDTADAGLDEHNDQLFSLQLTPEQVATFSSAQLLVLGTSFDEYNQSAYTPLYISEATLDESGLLTAAYTGRALYLTDGEGEPITGPLSFLGGSEPGRYTTLAVYWDNPVFFYATRTDYAAYTFDEPDSADGRVELYSPRIWDDASESYTNRISLDESKYQLLGFWHDLRILPKGGGILPGFNQWQEYNAMQFNAISLPQEWGLRFMDDQLTGTQLFATFQVTDIQQNTFCSPLIPVGNPNLSPLVLSPGAVENEAFRLETSAELNTAALNPSLNLNFKFTNLTDANVRISSSPTVLNGKRLTDVSVTAHTNETIEPGQSVSGKALFTASALEDLEAVTSIGFTIALRDADSYDPIGEYPVRFDLSGCDAEALAFVERELPGSTEHVADPVETDYARLKVKAQMNAGALTLVLDLENTGDMPYNYSFTSLCLDNRQTGLPWAISQPVDPGLSAMRTVVLNRNDMSLWGLGTFSELNCTMKVSDPETYATVAEIPLSFEIKPLDASHLAPVAVSPIAEGEAKGIHWELLALGDSGGGDVVGHVRIDNQSGRKLVTTPAVAFNGVVVLEGASTGDLNIAPGKDYVWTFDTMYNHALSQGYIGFDPDGFDFTFESHLPLDRLMNRHGFDEITSVTFVPEMTGVSASATLALPEPVPLLDNSEGMAMPDGAPILEGPVHAELYAVALGSSGVSLCVEFANDTDRDVWLSLQNARIGGESLSFNYNDDRFLLPARSALDTSFAINTNYALEEGTEIRDLSFEFEWHDGRDTVTIESLDGVHGPGLGIFMTPDQLTITPARIGG